MVWDPALLPLAWPRHDGWMLRRAHAELQAVALGLVTAEGVPQTALRSAAVRLARVPDAGLPERLQRRYARIWMRLTRDGTLARTLNLMADAEAARLIDRILELELAVRRVVATEPPWP